MASFGVPAPYEYFRWKEPIAVRHKYAPDRWHVLPLSAKIKRTAIVMLPWVILAIAYSLKPNRSAQAGGVMWFGVVFGIAAVLGLLVSFGIPMMNHYSRRRVQVFENAIIIEGGIRPAATSMPSHLFESIEREQVRRVEFVTEVIRQKPLELIRLHLGESLPITIGVCPTESPEEIRRYMKKWGYPVGHAANPAPNPAQSTENRFGERNAKTR